MYLNKIKLFAATVPTNSNDYIFLFVPKAGRVTVNVACVTSTLGNFMPERTEVLNVCPYLDT